MTGMSFDAFTRRAAETITRRRSLLALGAATAGAVVLPGSVGAGQCTKAVKRKCKQQVKQCVEAVEVWTCGQISNDITRQQCIDGCLSACEPKGGDCLNRENYTALLLCAGWVF